MAEHTIGELLKPQEGAGVRFTTKQSLSMDLHQHGINGFYRDGRFWSCDMSDHWTPHEVTNWTHTAVVVASPLPAQVPLDPRIAQAVSDNQWGLMTGSTSSPSIEREVSGEGGKKETDHG